MKKILVIAQREYMAMVATKAFLFTLFMMPILMFGGIVLMPLAGKIGGGEEQRILVIDGTKELGDVLKQAADARNELLKQQSESEDTEDKLKQSFEPSETWLFETADYHSLDDQKRIELSNQIRRGDLHAFIEIPPDIKEIREDEEAQEITFVSQNPTLSPVRQWSEATIQQYIRNQRLVDLEIDPQLVAQADQRIRSVATKPYTENDDGSISTKEAANGVVEMLLPFGVMMLMFMVIFLAAQPMLESGMEEKGQRIAEVLLGSVTPRELMTGKLLGNVGGSLLIFLLYGVCGFFIISKNGLADQIPWSLFPWFVVFQILGVFFFSSIFLTVGASIRDLKEAQGMLLPVWLVLMAPMMVWLIAVRSPNGTVALALSFFPPSSPMMMMLRLSSGHTIPWWQPPLTALLMLVATAGVVWVAAKIYRVSLLSGDSPKSLLQIIRRLRDA